MTRKIPRWRVTTYWFEPALSCKQKFERVYSAHTPSGAVVQAMVKWPPDPLTHQSVMREHLYKVEVKPEWPAASVTGDSDIGKDD